MHTREVKADLRISRRRAGLAQRDVAHFLGTTQPRISRLERGRATLGVNDVLLLCLLYDCSIDELLASARPPQVTWLYRRVADLPDPPANWERRSGRRDATIQQLRARLTVLKLPVDAG